MILSVLELKKFLDSCKDTDKVTFEIHEDDTPCDVNYGVDKVETRNGFVILISEN